jgi:PhzF family phenazine biosynthesis protein
MFLPSFREFNAESAFVSPREEDDPSTYNLKWFTPDYEADICGHATLGASHVLFDQPQNKDVRTLTFHTLSGVMKASKTDNGMVELDFPADDLVEQQGDVRVKIEKAAIASVRGQGRVKGVQLGRWYLTIELEMDKNVNLADVEVLPNELVSLVL